MATAQDFLAELGIDAPSPKEVKHWGVKGMRWGQRKARSAAVEAHRSEDSKAAKESLAKVKASGVSSLSNKELKALNERIQMEKKFSELTAPVQKTGDNAIQKLLKLGATANQVYAMANSPVGRMLRGNFTAAAAAATAAKAAGAASAGAKAAREARKPRWQPAPRQRAAGAKYLLDTGVNRIHPKPGDIIM